MKKRLISLILALSMVVSLCPVSAFAEADFTATDVTTSSADDIVLFAAQPTASLEFRDGRPYVADSSGTPRPGVASSINSARTLYTYAGNGWTYQIPCDIDSDGHINFQNPPYTLRLTQDADLNGQEVSKDVDVVVADDSTLKNATINGDLTIEPGSHVENVTCNGTVTNNGTIDSGRFPGDVENNGTISGGDFSGKVDNNAGGTIAGGDFSGDVKNNGTVSDGNFSGNVTNDGTVSGGTFTEDVTGSGTISGGVYDKLPTNYDTARSALSTVYFLDHSTFSVNDTLKNIRTLYVLTSRGGAKTVTLTSRTRFRNLYKEQSGTESWHALSDEFTADITVNGGTYILNLNDYTANDFRFDPAKRTVSWSRSDLAAPKFEMRYYGPDDAQNATTTPDAPGEYVVKIDVSGNNTYMKADGLTDSSWTFTLDPKLTFTNASATTADGQTLHSGDRIPVGTAVTLTVEEGAPFVKWDVGGDPLFDGQDLTSRTLSFAMPKRNLDLLAADTDLGPDSPSGPVNPVLTTLGIAAGGFAFYYIGTTAFMRTILPQECAFPTNRESLATALWVMCGRPEASDTTVVFTDVPETSSSLPAIRWAVEKGVMTGTVESDGLHFAPYRYTTRLEVFWTWYRMYLNDSKNAPSTAE